MPALSLSDFGRYTLIFNLALQIVFINKSLILNPMIKFAAEPGRFEKVSGAGLSSSVALYVVFGGVIAAVAPLAAKVWRIDAQDVLIAASLPLFFAVRDWGFCVQQTLYRTGRLFVIEAVYYLGSAAGYIWIRMSPHPTVVEVLYINLGAALASSLVTLAFWPKGVTLPLKRTWEESLPLIRYGVYTLGIGLSASLMSGGDALVLGAIYTPDQVGIYAGAKRIYAVISTLISTIGLLVMPYASRLQAEGRGGEVKALLEKSVGYVTLALLLVPLAGSVLVKPFFDLAMPVPYQASVPVLLILIWAAPFEGVYNITGSVLYGIGAAKSVAAGSFIGLGALAILLPTGAYYLGLNGTALSQVVGMVTVSFAMAHFARTKSGATARGAIGRVTHGAGHGWALLRGRK